MRFAPDAQDIAAYAAANAGKPANQQSPVAGKILSRTANYENIAKGYASGIDVSLSYQLPPMALGRFALSSDWSYLIRTYQYRAIAGSPALFTERLDVNGTTRWRGTSSLSWRNANWSAGLSSYYIGSYADTGATTTAANYIALGAPRYLSKQFSDGAYLYRYRVHDTVTFNAFVQRRFAADSAKWLRKSSIRLGVVNLADKEPPLESGNFGYNTGVYGLLFPGRTWTLELTRQF